MEVHGRGTLIYLDANVLVAGIVRTLVLLCGRGAQPAYTAAWSPYVESEAARHQPPKARPIADVRTAFDIPIVSDGQSPVPLTDTDLKDRPVIGSAAACGARLLITENVKDFGVSDLTELSMSAVHPDYFLPIRVSPMEYLKVLEDMSKTRSRFPITPADIHTVEVARRLPRSFEVYRQILGITEVPEGIPSPSRMAFRGVRCVKCSRMLTDEESIAIGLGPECRRHHSDLHIPSPPP